MYISGRKSGAEERFEMEMDTMKTNAHIGRFDGGRGDIDSEGIKIEGGGDKDGVIALFNKIKNGIILIGMNETQASIRTLPHPGTRARPWRGQSSWSD